MKYRMSEMWKVLGYFVSFWIIFLLSFVNYSQFVSSIDLHLPSYTFVARIGFPLLMLVSLVSFAGGMTLQLSLASRLPAVPTLHDLLSVLVFLASLVFWACHLFGNGYISKLLLMSSLPCYLILMSLDLVALRLVRSDHIGRWDSFQRKLIVVLSNLALTFFLLLAFESSFRAVTHIAPRSDHDYGTRQDFALAPYLMFAEPDVSNGGWYNLQGFEGPMLPPREEGKREIRIAVLGGSAAWSGRRYQSIAGFLEQELKSHPSTKGFDVTVINFGRQSYISMQELILLQRNVLPLGFDVIIVYDGYNDIRVPWNMEPLGIGYPFLYSSLKRRVESTQSINIPVVINILAGKSAIATFLRGRLAKESSKPDRFDLSECLEEYKRNLTQMAVLGTAYRAKMVFVTQPFVGTKKIRTKREDAFLPPKEMLAWQSYYRELSDVAQSVARKTKAHYIQMLDVFDENPDTVFLDAVHVRIEDNAVIARRIAQKIIAENLLRPNEGEAPDVSPENDGTLKR